MDVRPCLLSLAPCPPRAADSRRIGSRSVEVEGNGGGGDREIAGAKRLGLLLQLRDAGLGNVSLAGEVPEHVLDRTLVQERRASGLDQRHAGPEHSKDQSVRILMGSMVWKTSVV